MHMDTETAAALGVILTTVGTVVGGLLVKFWPVLTKSRVEREGAAAKIKQDAHEQVAQEYQDVIERQQKQLDALAARLDKVNASHTECLVRCENLLGRVGILEATLERVSTAQAIAKTPTRAEAIIVIDETGTILEWNQAATLHFHWESGEVIGKNVEVIVPPKYLPLHRAKFGEVVTMPRSVRRGPYLVEALTKDGKTVPVELTLSSWLTDDGARRIAASIRRLIADTEGRVVEPLGFGPSIKPLAVPSMPDARLTDDAIPRLPPETPGENKP
jgi:PAS domain S-box-containing protein